MTDRHAFKTENLSCYSSKRGNYGNKLQQFSIKISKTMIASCKYTSKESREIENLQCEPASLGELNLDSGPLGFSY